MEILKIPVLSPQEIHEIEQHSLLNMISVLHGELVCIGFETTGNPELLHQSLATCMRIREAFRNPEDTRKFAEGFPAAEKQILAEITMVFAKYPANPATTQSYENIANVLQLLQNQAKNTLVKLTGTNDWLPYNLPALRTDIQEFLAAIEKNSKGKYRIVYHLADQQPSDYYVSITLESPNGHTTIPLLFKDVMQNLIANARKYTAPGGIINITLHATADELKFEVQDTGCGIPPDELKTVFYYGQRGSNAQQRQTMGSGFGLTKAFLVTKRFGGRLWITSKLDVGTHITIILPFPKK